MNSPDIHVVFLAFVGGLFSTLLMTFVELPSWKRWGLYGVLEWHENQIITSKIFKLSSEKIHFIVIFALHFLNGGLRGVGFLLALWIFPTSVSQMFLSSITYGLFLWIVTLVPIHKLLTRVSPWSRPLGHLPALASLAGHIVYATALGYFFMHTPF